ncbi:uncharacterized protein LOC113640723 isoform X2 [Tachysurus fulvidraco]|uniref:uncharacterized protein LOC113640723 isoform X2 n=1 Tax=Tachysurus fulvidraco TaxID=1234273 RepID=UPI001FEEF63A|nr:uncharacterized protein LOC113640723 isoform X2 [Tachysurus fulvidraco]
MMKCLYLLYVMFHVAAGCDLSAQTKHVYIGHPGGSVLLLCSCSDLHTKPHTFTWMAYIRGGLKDMLNDEHYRGRLQLFDEFSPGNLSLLISDLREEDGVDYRCITEKGHRDMRILEKGCDLSGDKHQVVINGLPGGSVLLPCSCSDLHTDPQTFTWTTDRTGHWTDVLNDEHYRDRFQLFNHISPGNLSLLISDLREEDQRVYRCRTGLREYRDIRINVKGCDLSGDKHQVAINGHPGGSVLLPCSCSDLHTNPQIFTWTTNRTGHWTDVLNDEHYRDRLQLFNNISLGNLSLLISNLREEDQRVYRCSTGLREYRDIRINVKGRREPSTRSGKTDRRPPSEQPPSKTTNSPSASSPATLAQGGRRETLTRSGKTDRRPPSEQPPSKTTNSPPASSSTTLKRDEQPPHSSLPLVFGIVAALLLVIVGIMAFICWKRKGLFPLGGRRGKNKVTERRPKQKDQTVPDVTYSTVSHIHTAGAARVQINVEEKTEYASIVTN